MKKPIITLMILCSVLANTTNAKDNEKIVISPEAKDRITGTLLVIGAMTQASCVARAITLPMDEFTAGHKKAKQILNAVCAAAVLATVGEVAYARTKANASTENAKKIKTLKEANGEAPRGVASSTGAN